jgi:hypothetical protein
MCDGATQRASKSEASVKINTLGLLFRQGLSHRLRRGSHRECKSMKADGTRYAIESPVSI